MNSKNTSIKKTRKKKILPNRKNCMRIYERQKHNYEFILRKIHRRIFLQLKNEDLNANVKFRVKSFNSYFDKLLQLQDDKSKHTISDILGIRIICPFLEDLDRVEKIITDSFEIDELERKGLKHSFREFGYDSIHMSIIIDENEFEELIPYTDNICEIQLRTILQDAWAEVEHELIYKANFTLLNEPIKRKLASLNAILTLSDVIFQEIRDFQRETQQQGFKLRQTMESNISSNLSILDKVETPSLENSSFNLTLPVKPKDPLERSLLEGLEEHSKGNFRQAIQIYSRILRMKSNATIRSIIYNHRGMAWFILSEYRKAESDFSRAIEYDPGNYRAYNHRGLIERMNKKYKAALVSFEKSLSINRTQYECYYMRALTYFDLKDWAKSMNECEKVINIKPDFKPAIDLKQMIYREMFG